MLLLLLAAYYMAHQMDLAQLPWDTQGIIGRHFIEQFREDGFSYRRHYTVYDDVMFYDTITLAGVDGQTVEEEMRQRQADLARRDLKLMTELDKFNNLQLELRRIDQNSPLRETIEKKHALWEDIIRKDEYIQNLKKQKEHMETILWFQRRIHGIV